MLHGSLTLSIVAALATTLGAAPPSGAQPPARPATGPVAATHPSSDVTVTVRGRTWKSHGTVRLERRDGRHWRLVRRVHVRRHRFTVRVLQRAPVTTYRTATRHRHSRTFVVRRPAPPLTPATSTTDACGPRPARADGTLWSCTFADEFDGTALDRRTWVPQTAFSTGTAAAHACYLDDPGNIAVQDGSLRLTVRRLDQPVTCPFTHDQTRYTAGSVTTYHTFSQQYGRFDVRMKVSNTTAPGLQEDFWMWPDDRVPSTEVWPAAGEIDVAELYSRFPTLAIPFVHSRYDGLGGVPGVNTSWTCSARRGVFNTYTLEWTPQTLHILVNGRTCLQTAGTDAAFRKPYILALTAALGTGTNALTADTPLPATTEVDYVRVWK